MKIVRTIGLGTLVMVVGLVTIVPKTFAVDTAKQAIGAARCTVAEARLDKHESEATTTTANHAKTYNGIIMKVTNLITNAQKAGYDTTQLQAALTSVKNQYNTFSTNASHYQTALDATKKFACGQSDGQFTTSLATARTDLATLRTSAQSLRNTVITQLVPAIKAYAAWINAKHSANENKTESTEPNKTENKTETSSNPSSTSTETHSTVQQSTPSQVTNASSTERKN